MKCYLFDIDGTLADLSHRLPHIQKTPKDWDAFFDACGDDAPIPHIIGLAQTLSRSAHIVYVSGRSKRVETATLEWLARHLLPPGRLYMREDGDHRPDHKIKLELLAQLRGDGYQPIMAFDDRNQVVEMWRAAGIPCAQVAAGDF